MIKPSAIRITSACSGINKRETLITGIFRISRGRSFATCNGFLEANVRPEQRSRSGKGSIIIPSGTYSQQRAFWTKPKPTASEVLTCYLSQTQFPPWTSYFIKYDSIVNDQWGRSHFNWRAAEGHNYHILRTGCYPYIKYHCTKRPYQDLRIEDTFFRFIKVLNLGIPCLAYGVAATFLLRKPQAFTETVNTPKGPVTIYFLYKEDVGSMY